MFNIFSVCSKLAHKAAADGGIFGRAHKNNRFYAAQAQIHIGKVALILKILNAAHAMQKRRGAYAAGVVHCEAAIYNGTHARLVGIYLFDGRTALLGIGCAVLLAHIAAHSHHHLVEDGKRALHYVVMRAGLGVERARKKGCFGVVTHRWSCPPPLQGYQ